MDKLIVDLPVALYTPDYNYWRPSTNLTNRPTRNDRLIYKTDYLFQNMNNYSEFKNCSMGDQADKE